MTKNIELGGMQFGRWSVIGNTRKTEKSRHFWLCICACGTTRYVREEGLLSGRSRSCGCLHNDELRDRQLKNPGESSKTAVIYSYKSHAKERNLTFELTDDEISNIMEKNCYYCGEPPSNISKSRNDSGDFVYNGVDRKNNNLGYTLENCVPCCKTCNGGKSKMTEPEFLKWVEKIYNNWH